MSFGGGGGKGGGSTSVPKINVSNATSFPGGNLGTLLSGEQNLANYVSSLFPTAASLGNYAAAYATGGAAVPASGPATSSFLDPGNEYFGLASSNQNPSGLPYYPGLPSSTLTPGSWSPPISSGVGVQPTGPTASPGMEPVSGWYDYNVTRPADPGNPSDPANLTSSGGTFQGRYNPATGQEQIDMPGTGWQNVDMSPSTGNIMTATGAVPNNWQTAWEQMPEAQKQAADQMYRGVAGGATTAGSPSASSPSQGQMTSLINQELSNLQNEENIAGTPAPGNDPATFAALQRDFLTQSNTDLTKADALTGLLDKQGLLPNQAEMIDAATRASKSALSTQLANEGLSSSTQAAELGGEIDLAGAAAKGGLVQSDLQTVTQLSQQYISLAQNWAKMGMAEQTLSEAAKTDTFNMFSQISQQYGQAQGQMWQEALSGYGLLNSFVNDLLGVYGVSTQGFSSMLQAAEASTQAQAAIDQAKIQAQQQSNSSMMSSISSIVGTVATVALAFL